MTEKKEISFRVFLAQKAADASREAAESFSESAGLYATGDIRDARSKVIEGASRPQLVNDIASLIIIINTRIEEVELELKSRPRQYAPTFSDRLDLPEGYRLDLNLVFPEEKVDEQVLKPTGPQETTLAEEPETGPDQEARTNEEIFANLERLADQLPDNLLYSSLTLSSDLYWDHWDSKGTRNNHRYITVKDYLSDKKGFLEFRARTDFLIEIENSLREKQEAFSKAESGEVERDVVDSWLAPEKIKINEGIGTGSEITRLQYNTKIEDLNLSGRGHNQLLRAGLKRVGVILLYSEEELRSIRNFGAISYQELVECLKERGLWPEEKPAQQEAEPHIEIPPEATLFEEPELTKAYEPWQGEEIRFRKGTLGKQLSVILEGKRRPRWILEQKASEVNEFKGEKIKRALSKLGTLEELTVENVLTKQIWRLNVLGLRTSQVNTIQDSVKTFANNLQLPPEFKLLSSIYGERSRELIPPNAEKEEQLKDVICELISSLTSREAKVLSLRFGLEDFKELTYAKTGEYFDVTPERIRQIEAKALRKLRHPSRSRRLTPDFVEFVEKEARVAEGTESSPEQN